MKTNLLENQSVRQIDITKVKDNDSFLYADDIAV